MVMSIDPLKTNLTADEANQLLVQQTNGKTFSDGPYDYRVVVKNTDIINGLIITVINDPDHIGPDLIRYVLRRLEVIVRNFKEKNNMEFYIIKIWMDVWGHTIKFHDEMLISESDPDLTFATKDTADKYYKTIDFTEGRHRRNVTLKKLNRYIDYFNDHHKKFHVSFDDVSSLFSKDAKRLFLEVISRATGVGQGTPAITFYAHIGMNYHTTIEDGDLHTEYNVHINGNMDVASSDWVGEFQGVVQGDWLNFPEIKNADWNLKQEITNAWKTMIEKALQPTVEYFKHSLVHITELNATITRPKGKEINFHHLI